MNKIFSLSVLLLSLAALGHGQMAPLPPNIKVEEKLGAQIPLDLEFKDEDGKDVKLRDFFGKKPIALMLIFYKCGGTCLTELQEATKSFRALKTYDIGREFDVLTVSIHPKEEPWLAKNT
jgi:protein SCO1